MNCDRARQSLCDTPGVVARALLGLHLLRCPACRAEANQVRALDAALTSLPRFDPSPDLLPRVLAGAQGSKASAAPIKETRPMKRLAFVAVFLIVIGVVVGGVLIKPDRPDGRSLLISVAQAMEEAKTIYVRGRANVSHNDSPPWGELDEGYYEQWYSPDGSRHDMYDAEGNLLYSSVMNVASGMAWIWGPPSVWFPDGLVTAYPMGAEALADIVDHARQSYLQGAPWFAPDIQEGRAFTTCKGTRDGNEVTVVEVDQGIDPLGLPRGTVEFYLGPSTGRLLGLKQYGPESHGKPLTADMQLVEYGIDIPSSVFGFDPPPEALVLEGDFELREEGNYCLVSPGGFRGPDELTPNAAWHASGSHTVRPANPASAIDGDFDTGWNAQGSAHLQQPGMWFQLNFDAPVRVSRMMVQHAAFGSGPAPGWPRGIQVSASTDGITWQDVYTGPATPDLPAFAYFGSARTAPEVVAIRLTLTEVCDEEPWTIREIRLDGPPHF